MLHYSQAKSLDDIYLEDIPHIIHPETAARDLANTALQNRIIQEWNLPQGYTLFVSRYHKFHWQRPWMAYRDTLDDIKSGALVLLRQNITGYAISGVLTTSGGLLDNLPLLLRSRLNHLISRQLKRPVYHVRPAAPVQYAQSAKPSIAKPRAGCWLLAEFITAISRGSERPPDSSAAMLQPVSSRSWITKVCSLPAPL